MPALKNKKILVTGASGFLGRHLLPLLLASGAETTCLARDPKKLTNIDARVVRGDLADGSGLADAVKGQDIVIHMAALLFGLGWRDYLAANSRAATNLVRALDDSAASVVFVSSLAAAGPSATGKKETDHPAPVSAYGWSKLMAENIILGRRPDALIMRPPIIYGSGDRGLLPVFRAAARGFGVSPGARREFPVSIIHADDAARAILTGAEKNASGVYHLADGGEHTMASFCRAIGAVLGKSVRVLRPPLPLMGASASAVSFLAALASRAAALAGREIPPPQWNIDKYREAKEEGWVADATKIRADLGFEARIGVEEGTREAALGYANAGWL